MKTAANRARYSGFSAVAWSGADSLLRQVGQFAITVALARLLMPADFGAVAALALILGLATMISDAGLTASIIQRSETNQTEQSTAFWINVAISLLLAIGIYIAAPALASFFSVPTLGPLGRVLCICVPVSALGMIPTAVLTKQLDFRSQMIAGFYASVLSGAAAIWMAINGFGVWSLAAQLLLMNGITTLLVLWFSQWRPKLQFRCESAKEMLAYGKYVLLAGALDVGYNRLYTVFIAKTYDAAALGFYHRAETTRQLPFTAASSALHRVLFPVLAEAPRQELEQRLRVSIRDTFSVNAPLMLGLAAVAPQAVTVIFGPKWLSTIPILQILCLASLFWPINTFVNTALMSTGRSRTLWKSELVKKASGVALMLCALPFGLLAIAWSQVAHSLVVLAINLRLAQRYVGYTTGHFLADLAPSLAVALCMSVLVYALGHHLAFGATVQLFVLVLSGSIIFLLGACFLLRPTLNELRQLLRQQNRSHRP